MPKKILLTGGTGFLGSHLSDELFQSGHDLTLYVRKNSSYSRLELIADKIKFVSSLKELENDYDTFYHLATCYGRNGESDLEIKSVNTDLALNIISKIQSSSLEIILVGTSLPENLNTYSKTKWDLYHKLNRDGVKHVLLEHFYGPKDNSFVGFVIKTLTSGEEKIDFTEGTQTRDFIYYKDVVNALIFIMGKKLSGNIPLGLGHEYSIREVVEKVKKYFPDSRTKFNWGAKAYRENEVMSSCANLKILNSLGWKPQYNLESGLADFLV